MIFDIAFCKHVKDQPDAFEAGGFRPDIQPCEPLPPATGTAEVYFFTLSTSTQTRNFLLFTLPMKKKVRVRKIPRPGH